MMTLLKGGLVYAPQSLGQLDLLVYGGKIKQINNIDGQVLGRYLLETEELDCTGCVVTPGFIDCHAHLIGGSGELFSFATATPEIFFSEIVSGGITTIVGTLGVDTSAKTMRALLAKVKSLKSEGLSAYCYVGGYDLSPSAMLLGLRDDLLFFDEVIGIGELAISDSRSVEFSANEIARLANEAYISHLLTGKAGVLHVHTGPGRKHLYLLHRALDEFDVKPESFYATHIERDSDLVDDGIRLSQRGSFIDFDVQEKDLFKWFTYYREHGGRLDHLSASSDAGMASTSEIHGQIIDCVLNHKLPLEEILPLVTVNPAKALRFLSKGKIQTDFDADILVMDKSTLEIKHVLAGGQILFKNGSLVRHEAFLKGFRRKVELYGQN